MTVKPYKALISVDGNEEIIYYWSTGNVNSKKNVIDAGLQYMKTHEDFSGNIRVLKAKRMTYKEALSVLVSKGDTSGRE